ncbi:MAG: UvrD-helicase domain-containing protein [Deltaproteobacteria bacterium]|nr:UvrD-helicase domain-containing protein [Deltaproteobacteria bacterium]
MTDRATLFGFARNTVLRAGAGTGKTETLATLFLHLAGGLCDQDVWGKSGLSCERIVALTFTDKAAVEMRERITDAMRALAYESPPTGITSSHEPTRRAAARKWADSRGLSRGGRARMEALAESAVRLDRPLPMRTEWERVAFQLARARIGTFHGFAAGVLRAIALDVGVDPTARVCEQEEADRLLRKAITDALANAARRDVDAVADLVAAAGGFDPEGDHGVVVRFVSMVHAMDEAGLTIDELSVGSVLEGSPPQPYIVADAIAELSRASERVARLREDNVPERMARLARAMESLGPLDSPRSAREAIEILRTAPLPDKNRTRAIETEANRARTLIDALKDAALATHSAWLSHAARDILHDARHRFGQLKAQRRVLDFADLLRKVRDGLRDEHALRRAFKQRFDAVLVDEFQDTNRVQRDLLFLLREQKETENEGVADASRLEPSGLLLVGDAKQSIYAFRGADVGVFLETERDLCNAGGVSLALTESYRSVDAVLHAINPVTAALLGRDLTAHGQPMYDPARDALVAESAGDGEARVELMLVGTGTAAEVRALEAQAIVRRIKKLTQGGGDYAPGWRAPRMDEIAVLVPTWAHMAPIKQALQSEQIPYAQLGGPGFWERREVDDLVMLLRVVADPADRLALASVLRGPIVALSDAALAHVMGRQSTFDSVLDPHADVRDALAEDDLQRLDRARPMLRKLIERGAALAPDEVLRSALAESGFAAVLAALPLGAQRVANVDKLVGLATEASRRGDESATIAGFVRFVDRMRAADEHETEADIAELSLGAVQLLSMHAAKGLEWPVVFLAQTSRRRRNYAERVLIDARKRVVALPPGYDAPQSFVELRRDAHAAEADDQRRLLYVGLTRAKDLVIVSGPSDEGEGEWRSLSRALMSLTPEHVRLVRGDSDGEAIAVRANAADTQADPRAATAMDPGAIAAQPEPKRTALAVLGRVEAEALSEFARCPRRYAHRYTLGLREHPSRETLERLVRMLVTQAMGCPAGAEAQTLAGLRAAHRDEGDPATLEAAVSLARGALARATGRAMGGSQALVGANLAGAVRIAHQGHTLALTTHTDLLVQAEALDPSRAGLAVLRIALEGGVSDADWWRDELVGSVLTMRAKLPENEPLHAAVWFVGQGEDHLAWLTPRELGRDRDRVFEQAQKLGQALTDQHWDGRARGQCERALCGYVQRCHG